jgi:hypothetical protein
MTRDPVSALPRVLEKSRAVRSVARINSQISRHISNHYFVAFGLIVLISLSISGLSFFEASTSTWALFSFAAPLYVWLSHKSIDDRLPHSEIAAVFFSLIVSSASLALLFGFTSLSTYSLIFWMSSAVCVLVAIFLRYWIPPRKTQFPRNSQDLTGLISTMLLLFLSSVYLKSTNPYDPIRPKWVPDDYPFFAMLGKDISLGLPGEAFFENLSFNYHWLTYSLFGGINRITNTDYILGTLRIAPIFSWLLLCLGAVLLVQIFSTRKISVILATTSVMFSSALGVLIFSIPSLGGLFISPSTLITASWMVALLIFINSVTTRGSAPHFIAPLLLALGFTMALGKITTAAAALIGIAAIVGFNSRNVKNRRSSIPMFVTAQALITLPFALGILIESLLFLRGTETPITIEDRLLPTQLANPTAFLINIIPVLAALFAVAVMVLPIFFAMATVKRNALYFAAAVTSIVGLALVFVLELPAGNEAWFIVAILALALPLSSVVVVDSVSYALVTNKKFISIKALVTLIMIIVLPILLLIYGKDEFFIIKAWVVPAILATVSLCLSLMWRFPSRRLCKGSELHGLFSLAVAFLFLTSVVYGFVLRTDSAATSSMSRGEDSQSRDAWLEASRNAALSARSEVGSSPIAIYSESPGELALTRWIPYFLDTRAYTLGALDELTDFYTPAEEIESRQQWVSAYVRSRDPISCQELNAAGVQYIWITQGFNSSTSQQNEDSKPSLLPVRCT